MKGTGPEAPFLDRLNGDLGRAGSEVWKVLATSSFGYFAWRICSQTLKIQFDSSSSLAP